MTDSALIQIGVPLGLFIVMFGLGTTLSRQELKGALTDLPSLSLGLLGQVVLLPLLGLVIALLAPVSAPFKLGILLIACCPGGTTSNIFAHLARGNLALSVSLTTLSSLLSLFSMPILLALGVAVLATQQHQIDVPQALIIKGLFAVTILPVGLGILFRRWLPGPAHRIEPYISRFSTVFLLLLILGIGLQEHKSLMANAWVLAPLLIVLSGTSMMLGLILAKLIRAPRRNAITIGLETGVQNSGLAIFIALSVLQDAQVAIPAGIYSVSMYLCAGIMVWVGRRHMSPLREGLQNRNL